MERERERGREGREGERGRNVEGPGKWSAPGPALALGGPEQAYWNSTSGFDFDHNHRSRHVILHQSPKFYPKRTTLGRKNDIMSIFKMADHRHLGF